MPRPTFALTPRRTCLALSLAALALFAQADTLTGRVVAVADGDTVTVLDEHKTQHRIRLQGIDAPEKAQPFGERSRQHPAQRVFGQTVEVEHQKKDRYGRIVGKILLNQQDINLEMVQVGLAWHYKQYQSEQSAQDRIDYASAEEAARQQSIGLWQDADPIPPWTFRRPRSR